ncbi:MAG: hypothetical protein ACO25F_02215 [Erythrobacter sp.]
MIQRPTIRILAAGMCAALAATPVLAEKANRLTDINGARGRDAEPMLQQRGFAHVSTHKSDSGYVNSYWWNERDDNCVVVELYDGRVMTINDATDQDCGHHKGSAGAAVGAVAGAAILGALLTHKSHHHEDKQHAADQKAEADYERGYNDGLYNAAYHNYDRSEQYASGYQAGVDEREANLRNHNRRGGYAPASRAPTPGSNERAYYDDGCEAGKRDAQASMSMYYGRHPDGYDRRFEPYFKSGYEECWAKFR